MSRRSYNKVYMVGPLVIQVLTEDPVNGFVIELTPSVGLVVNGSLLHFGLSLQWIFGTINIGLAKKEFIASENARHLSVQKEATKLGITKRQQELRWGW